MDLQTREASAISAYLELMASHPYDRVSMAMVAQAAGLTLAQLRQTFASEDALLEGFAAWADSAMLEQVANNPTSGGPRARLIGAMMARFHVLLPHKAAVRSILIGAAADPAALMFFNRVSVEEHKWSLIAAGLNPRGARGRNLAEAVSQAFVAAAGEWLAEVDEAMPLTQAVIEANFAYGDDALLTFEMPMVD